MRIPELIENFEKDCYVVTVSVFPGTLNVVSVDISIPIEEWQRQKPEDIAQRYLAAAIALIKSKDRKSSHLVVK